MFKKLSPLVISALSFLLLMQCDSVNQYDETDDLQPDNVPELLAPANGSEYQTPTEFHWKGVSDTNTYRLQISVTDDFSEIVRDTVVTGVTFVEDQLKKEDNYFWRVMAESDKSVRNWSIAWIIVDQGNISPNPIDYFVKVRDNSFSVNNNSVNFVGSNAYYLPNYMKLNEQVVDNAFDSFEAAGINVLRMWAFYDGYDCGYSQNDPSENVIQTSPGVYNENALRDLDKVIAKGKERDIRFILPFVNYWDELGGICQYNTWAGASNPGRNMDFFINNEQTQQWYRDYIEMLLNRVNTVTGIKYKDEPAIMAWQIVNEGRNQGKDAQILRDWYQEIAQFIKSIDSNHLLSTGEEGFDNGTPSEYSVSEYSNTYVLRANEGTSYILNTAIPEIDFGSAHWYPQDFGFGNNWSESMRLAQNAWMFDHQNIAANMGKPFIMGEWGHHGWNDTSKKAMYDNFYSQAKSLNLDGSMIWQLTADGTKCWEFPGNICYPGGRADVEFYNSFKAHIQAMKSTN